MASTAPRRLPDVPSIVYGTAFKFEKSTALVEAALKAGFRAIDTAGSKSAYREALVGKGIEAALSTGTIERNDLYIQTKFSPFKTHQDPALYPYETTKSIPEQVEESISSSLRNLGVTYIDCLVLHSLYPSMEDNIAAWKAMEALVPEKVSLLGLSNIDLDSLIQLYDIATVKPIVVQNRFTHDTIDRPDPNMPSNLPYPKVTFDRDVRQYCAQKSIVYAPWGMLWGSLEILDGPEQNLTKAAQELGVSRQIACFGCMRSLGSCQISILCGTTKEATMQETLAGLAKIQRYQTESDTQRDVWNGFVERLRRIVDG